MKSLIKRKILLRSRITKQMQRRLIHLWNASTKYQYLQELRPDQKKYVDLWNHIQNCTDINCKHGQCLSSRQILAHFRRCRTVNGHSACNFCSPVIKQIAQESHPNTLTISQQDIPQNKKAEMDRARIFEFAKDKTSISFEPSQFLSVPHNTQSAAPPIKKPILSQNQRRTRIRWCKSVNFRQGKDKAMQDMRAKKLKKCSISQPQTHKIETAPNYKNEQILKETTQDQIDVSIALLSLKK